MFAGSQKGFKDEFIYTLAPQPYVRAPSEESQNRAGFSDSIVGSDRLDVVSRARNVPSYGASPSFIKDSDEFAHGLNERIPLLNVRPGVTYYLSVLTELASR